MSQKQVSTALAADIQRVIDDSCEADTGNEILQMGTSNTDTCKVKTFQKDKYDEVSFVFIVFFQ